MAGRPKKPSHLKLVTGTARADRTNPREPKPAKMIPDAPEHLSVRGKRAWRHIAPLLLRMGVLTEADGPALERLCECYAEILDARASFEKDITFERMSKDGNRIETVVVAEGGKATYLTFGQTGPMLRTRTELAQIADADRRLRGYLADFGLTPSARSKVNVLPQGSGAGADNPAAKYF